MNISFKHRSLLLVFPLLLLACSANSSDKPVEPTASSPDSVEQSGSSSIKVNPDKDAYFGDFHIHTSYSFDGYANGGFTTPDDAYRWAKGEAIPGGWNGSKLQIKVPLDWYAVSDHSEFLGLFKKMEDPVSPASKLSIAPQVTSKDKKVSFDAYVKVLDDINKGIKDPELLNPEISKSIWKEIVATAEAHNDPGKFTTFSAFEWTSAPDNRNLHRVVVFENAQGIPELPYSKLDSGRPEDLWAWMDTQRANGASLFAVPHNGNASNGLMFPETTSYGGSQLDKDYAAKRMRNEPLYEVSQIKGTSETHPDLSPNDEFAGFEIWDYTLSALSIPASVRVGSYVRDAFLRGMQLEAEGKGNPFKYGIIGDSDAHNSAAVVEEDNYTGKFALDNSPEHRLNGPRGFEEKNARQIRQFSSGGLAGIWAESNTREALVDAIHRKETFGTSGTRLKVRFFAGYQFDANLLQAPDWVQQAYASGVPMGSDLPPSNGAAPSFIVHAVKEVNGANLDRVQIIKGWLENGKTVEKIYDVALSDGRTVGANGEVAPVGNTVDASTATYSNDIGATQLATVWTDPDFDPATHAFYYVRALEIPTPRWSTYDAVTLGVAPRDDIPVSIQERAWTSPIWYTPAH